MALAIEFLRPIAFGPLEPAIVCDLRARGEAGEAIAAAVVEVVDEADAGLRHLRAEAVRLFERDRPIGVVLGRDQRAVFGGDAFAGEIIDVDPVTFVNVTMMREIVGETGIIMRGFLDESAARWRCARHRPAND